MELVRKLMLAIAVAERPLDSLQVRIAHYPAEQVAAHIRQMHDARLVDGSLAPGPEPRTHWTDLRLTWLGHDFVECARSETIWHTAQELLGADAATASLDTWRKTLIEATYRVLGRSPEDSTPATER